jgi:CRP-like cAMP-binding protein
LGPENCSYTTNTTLLFPGDRAEAIFFLHRGRAKLTAVSTTGKEATITLLRSGDFVWEDSLITRTGFRTATATAITACTVLRIEKAEFFRVMHEEHTSSDVFVRSPLARSIGTQADLVDQLLNSSEKRLALLLLDTASRSARMS